MIFYVIEVRERERERERERKERGSVHVRVLQNIKEGLLVSERVCERESGQTITLTRGQVTCGVAKWSVHRSFVDFCVLHRILGQTYPTIEFPELPSRSAENKNNLVKMRGKLQTYLRDLLDCSFEENLSKVDERTYGTMSEPNMAFSYFLQTDIRAFLFDGQVARKR